MAGYFRVPAAACSPVQAIPMGRSACCSAMPLLVTAHRSILTRGERVVLRPSRYLPDQVWRRGLFEAGEHDFVFLPAGVPHAWRVVSETPGTKLILAVHGGIESFSMTSWPA